MRPSPYLEDKMARANSYCSMQIVFVDIVSYSMRRSYRQLDVIRAFMKSIEEALTHTARKYINLTERVDVIVRRDLVLLPLGDGAAIGFPFDFAPEMHLYFACELMRLVDEENEKNPCEIFREQGWCDCHNGFLLRCGISEGKLILYKDLNGNFNIAGDTVNMAARVMNLADGGQIFLTREAHSQIAHFIHLSEPRFRKYSQVRIKHDLIIEAYQYIDESSVGVDVSPKAGLDLADAGQQFPVEIALQVNSDRERDIDPQTNGESANSEEPSGVVTELSNRMRLVPAGEFSMGNEHTGRVLVEISTPLLVDKYPITQDDYESVMGRNPSKFVGSRLPVDSVSWLDAVTFCNRLSELSKLKPAYDLTRKDASINLDANGYRLPSESEWEYCCRGGSQDDRYGPIDEIAWYNGNAQGKSQEVGKKIPNAFGLCDMLGNVWEWCNDWYQKGYPNERQVGYTGPDTGFERVLRGGSWRDLPDCVSVSFRHRKSPLSQDSTHGLRVVRPSISD